jgi:hypothetical protein
MHRPDDRGDPGLCSALYNVPTVVHFARYRTHHGRGITTMADRTHATIDIGGRLMMEDVPALVTALCDAGLGPIGAGPFTTRQDAVAAVMEAHGRGDPLRLEASEVVGGHFPALETVLARLGVAYVRADEGCIGSWGPRIVYRPAGHAEVMEWPKDDADGPTLSVGRLRELLADGPDALRAEMATMELVAAFDTPLHVVGMTRDDEAPGGDALAGVEIDMRLTSRQLGNLLAGVTLLVGYREDAELAAAVRERLPDEAWIAIEDLSTGGRTWPAMEGAELADMLDAWLRLLRARISE